MMKITGTRSYMDVEMDDGKMVRIQGELLMNGFLAYSDTIIEWELPKGEPINEESKRNIIQKVLEVSKKPRHLKIEFE